MLSKEELSRQVSELVEQGLKDFGQEGRTIVQTTEVVDLLLDIKALLK